MNDLKKKLISGKRHMERFELPELECAVHVRRMNGLEREDFMVAQAGAHEKKEAAGLLALQSKIVHLTACDEDGDPIFDSEDEVHGMDGMLLERLALKALEVNGLTKESRDAIEKKASATTGSGST